MHTVSDEVRYRLLKYLAEHPDATQRQVATELGVSLGKANYCLHALMQKGLVKVRNFTSSSNKSAYAYILTPSGLEEKVNVTYRFLRRKMTEYDLLAEEIERLRAEVLALGAETESAV
jgi:EPS-associated MarR family transcriptional regulator